MIKCALEFLILLCIIRLAYSVLSALPRHKILTYGKELTPTTLCKCFCLNISNIIISLFFKGECMNYCLVQMDCDYFSYQKREKDFLCHFNQKGVDKVRFDPQTD